MVDHKGPHGTSDNAAGTADSSRAPRTRRAVALLAAVAAAGCGVAAAFWFAEQAEDRSLANAERNLIQGLYKDVRSHDGVIYTTEEAVRAGMDGYPLRTTEETFLVAYPHPGVRSITTGDAGAGLECSPARSEVDLVGDQANSTIEATQVTRCLDMDGGVLRIKETRAAGKVVYQSFGAYLEMPDDVTVEVLLRPSYAESQDDARVIVRGLREDLAVFDAGQYTLEDLLAFSKQSGED